MMARSMLTDYSPPAVNRRWYDVQVRMVDADIIERRGMPDEFRSNAYVTIPDDPADDPPDPDEFCCAFDGCTRSAEPGSMAARWCHEHYTPEKRSTADVAR